MITKKLIKDYQFQEIENYFGYIIDSHTNGQFKQMKELISKLSKQQKKDFGIFLLNDETLVSKEAKEKIFSELI